MKLNLLTIALSLTIVSSVAQQKRLMNGAEIGDALERFNTLGSVLYVAAHPDDENTRLIAYLANDKKLTTGYLSLTRGDGGQNLIGTEKGPLLGIVRTQELMEARKVDGGQQFFSRAVDFGYSKSADETYAKWGKQEVLADMVWVIRKFQPDVIVTRFNPEGYNGHGHHSASAILAMQAYKMAADKMEFPDQLEYVEPWQARRILLNASTWWDKELPQRAKTDPEYLTVDVGQYSPALGMWTNELASLSRSQHKSQGFGVSRWRGSRLEYLKHMDGEQASKDLMSGINTSWTRVNGSLGIMMDEIIYKYDSKEPSKSLPDLMRIYQKLSEMDEGIWKMRKMQELTFIIQSCSGLFVEVNATKPNACYGDEVQVEVNTLLATDMKAVLKKIEVGGRDTTLGATLSLNEALQTNMVFRNEKRKISQPYWLEKPFTNLFDVKNQQLIGLPENRPEFDARLTLELNGKPITVTVPVRYKWTTRVEGERTKAFVLTPEFTVDVEDQVLVFSGNLPKKINVKVKAHKAGISGVVGLDVPNGWKVEPSTQEVSFISSGVQDLVFELTPPFVAGVGEVRAYVKKGEEVYNRGHRIIDYPHIEEQVYFPRAVAKLVRLDVLNRVRKVGYVAGAGDEVPSCLSQIGVSVDMLDPKELGTTRLAAYEAIVTGVRAYNTVPELKYNNQALLDYVYNGGTLIVQYNTSRGLVTDEIGPSSIKFGRDRVTDEDSEVEFLDPKHAVLNSPNEITRDDFDNWVQERGLYFASEWATDYEPILSWNDKGEDPKQGALLVASHGKGSFVFTGISFFRQLPAGVPGAYRLFANILSYRK